jgi:hypothetical protein
MTDIEKTKKTSSWMIALKEYNKQVGGAGVKFIVPRKGSEEHSKVVDIMNKYKTENNIVSKPKRESKKKVVEPPPPLEVIEVVEQVEPVKKVKTVRKKKITSTEASGINNISSMSKEDLIKELLSKI